MAHSMGQRATFFKKKCNQFKNGQRKALQVSHTTLPLVCRRQFSMPCLHMGMCYGHITHLLAWTRMLRWCSEPFIEKESIVNMHCDLYRCILWLPCLAHNYIRAYPSDWRVHRRVHRIIYSELHTMWNSVGTTIWATSAGEIPGASILTIVLSISLRGTIAFNSASTSPSACTTRTTIRQRPAVWELSHRNGPL